MWCKSFTNIADGNTTYDIQIRYMSNHTTPIPINLVIAYILMCQFSLDAAFEEMKYMSYGLGVDDDSLATQALAYYTVCYFWTSLLLDLASFIINSCEDI